MKKFEKKIEDRRRTMALNIYSLAAYSLHPKYTPSALALDDMSIIQDFLIDNLDAAGISSLSDYQQKRGIFEKSFSKEVTR